MDETLAGLLNELSKGLEEQKKTTKFNEEIPFPVTVKSIGLRVESPLKKQSMGYKAGQLVGVRSVKPEHGDKTRLGILVGFVPINAFTVLTHPEGNPKEGTLEFCLTGENPLIFIPELGESVLGAESWWGVIKSEEELKQITDQDIQDVWYVKLMKELWAKKEEKG